MAERILVVDDEEIIRESIAMILEKEGYKVDKAENGGSAFEKISAVSYDLVITDIEMPVMRGVELLEKIGQRSPQTFVIIITAYGSVETAIGALRKGAYDYILKPIEFDDLLFRVKKLFEHRNVVLENALLKQEINRKYDFHNIIGKSDAMKRVFSTIEKVSTSDGTVLVSGTSGTGKELVARAIHFHSARKNKRFVAINCGAIVETLFESELFGHKKGSFTGATEDKMGLFKVADGGTLFLDEIGDLPLNLQVKLLRAIEDKQFLPVGGTKHVTTDVRIIAATNQNIYEKTKTGEFREDLYYRLNVVEIKLPSLNEKKDDIPLLVNHFIEKACNEMGKKIIGVDNESMKLLINHDWRGGVRELENVIERAVIFAKKDMISVDDLTENVRGSKIAEGYPDSLKDALKNFEKEHINKIIQKFDYNKEEAAKALKIGLSSLYRKMEDLGIPTKSPKDFE